MTRPCGCGDRHAITCPQVAAGQPHAMVNQAGDVFYPDGFDDCTAFTLGHGARFVDPDAGAAWLTSLGPQLREEDPSPTTGGPGPEFEFPDGCLCHIKEDIDRGDVYVAPPNGCPVHTPWASPGYSLLDEVGS